MRYLLILFVALIANSTFAQKGKGPQKGYDNIGPYNKKGWAKVQRAGKVGYIDKSGVEVIECIYDEILPFEKDLLRKVFRSWWAFKDVRKYIDS